MLAWMTLSLGLTVGFRPERHGINTKNPLRKGVTMERKNTTDYRMEAAFRDLYELVCLVGTIKRADGTTVLNRDEVGVFEDRIKSYTDLYRMTALDDDEDY